MKERILSLIRSGMTDPADIAKATGCAEYTVYRVAQDHGLTVSRERTYPVSDREIVPSTIGNGKYEHLRVSRLVMRRVFGCSMTPRNFECVAVPEGVLIRKAME